MVAKRLAMAHKVPPLSSESFPKGSLDEVTSPRLNEQMTPRALFEMVKDDQNWAVLLDDPSGQFGKGDIIDVRYQKYLAEVVPIMVSHDVSFKTAVDMLANKAGKAQGSQAKGSPKKGKPRKEVIKDHGDPAPKLREAVDEKDQPDLKVIDEKEESLQELEPKALDVDMEQKSLTTRSRDFTKAMGRSSSEPITPKRPDKEQALLRQQGVVPLPRPDQVAERVVYVERTQIPHKAVAIQTEEAPPSQLLQPLLSGPAVPSSKPKVRRKQKEEIKEIPIQYQDCSCGRIIFSNSMKFILACALLVAAMWCAENYDEVVKFFNGPFRKQEPATTARAGSKKDHKKDQKSAESKESKHSSRPHHEEKPESHSHGGTGRQGEEGRMHPTPRPMTDLQLAKEELKMELKKLERLDQEQAQTARVGELARLSQKENEHQAAQSQNKDEHLRQAALDAEVQAKVAQQELEEDSEIRKQKQKVKDAQALVDELESAHREKDNFLALK